MRRTLSRGLAGAAALATALTVVATATPASAATPDPLDYVALGDSYSAGAGVLPKDLSAPPLCIRTTKNYPRLIASATGAALRDVTCTAADPASCNKLRRPDTGSCCSN